jgi:mRNA interferase MazF
VSTDSVLNVSQVLVVDKSRLERCRGTQDEVSLEVLNRGLKLVLGLEHLSS